MWKFKVWLKLALEAFNYQKRKLSERYKNV